MLLLNWTTSSLVMVFLLHSLMSREKPWVSLPFVFRRTLQNEGWLALLILPFTSGRLFESLWNYQCEPKTIKNNMHTCKRPQAMQRVHCFRMQYSVCAFVRRRVWQNKISKFTVAASSKAHVHTFSPVKQLYNILCNTQTAATHAHTLALFHHSNTVTHIHLYTLWRTHIHTRGKKPQQSSELTQSYVVRGIQFHSCQTSLYFFIAFFSPPNTVLCASTHTQIVHTQMRTGSE